MQKYKDDVIDHIEPVIHPAQLEHDKTWLYGMFESSLRGNLGSKQQMLHKESQDGIMVWIQVLDEYDHGGSSDIRIEILEDIVHLPCNPQGRESLMACLNNFESAIIELGTVIEIPEWSGVKTHKKHLVKTLIL